MTKKSKSLALNIVESASWGIGPAILGLNLVAFKASKSGYYFTDSAEWGIGIGIFILSLGYICRFWR